MPKQNIEVVEKPWGKEIIFAHTRDYVGKEIRINAGALLSRQYHREKDETVYVLTGPLILEIGEGGRERLEIQPGEAFHVPPKTVHRYIAPQHTECRLIEVSTTQLDDVVRLEDRYGRTGGNG